MRWGVAFLLLLATLVQVTVIGANAAPDEVTVTGRVVDTKLDEPLAGVELLVFNATPDGQGQDQLGEPIAKAVSQDNGRFRLSIPRAEPWPLVRIHVVPPAGLDCANIALVGVIGAATAYHARGDSPTFSPTPSATQSLNQDGAYSTFEMMGTINADGSCTGTAGLFKGKELE